MNIVAKVLVGSSLHPADRYHEASIPTLPLPGSDDVNQAVRRETSTL